MILTVKPASTLKGTVKLPASKSYSIRAFMTAACGGSSIIVNPSNCEDALVSVQIARHLGARIKVDKNSAKSRWHVVAARNNPRYSKINVNESGTVLRFLLPQLAYYGKKATVVGKGTLRGRPNYHLTRTLRKMGIDIRGSGKKESIPVRMNGGKLEGGKLIIDGSLSSQFISALLMTCPRLMKNSKLLLQGKNLVSTDYIAMTCQVIEKKGLRQYRIRGNQKFKGLKNFTVPSDYGLAAFLMASAVLTKSNVVLTGNLKDDLIQADAHILPLMKRMGVKFQKTTHAIRVKGPQPLRGGVFSLKNCPDLVPIMAVLALFAKGKTRLINIAHVRSKESDRISDLRKELLKVGANIKEKRDALIIDPQDTYRSNCLLDPHNDHRLAMSFCVLGSKLGARVKDIECTRKSYPDFVKDFRMLGNLVRSE